MTIGIRTTTMKIHTTVMSGKNILNTKNVTAIPLKNWPIWHLFLALFLKKDPAFVRSFLSKQSNAVNYNHFTNQVKYPLACFHARRSVNKTQTNRHALYMYRKHVSGSKSPKWNVKCGYPFTWVFVHSFLIRKYNAMVIFYLAVVTRSICVTKVHKYSHRRGNNFNHC